MRTSRAALVGAALAFVVPSEAFAAGYSVARFGGEHGHPTATNPTAIYYNPAGIGFSEGTHLYVNGDIAWRRMTYSRPASDTDDASFDGANSGKNTLFNVVGSPMLGVSTKLGDLALGAAFFTPFGGASYWNKADEFDDASAPGVVDGPQRWYTIDGQLRSSFIAANAAYQIADMVSLGVSLNLIMSSVTTLRARTLTGDDNINQEGRSLVDASGMDWSFGVGVMVEVVDDTAWVGASFQSGPNPFFSNELVLSGTLTNSFPSQYESTESEIDFHTDLPEVFRAGVTYKLARDIELRMFGDYSRWSTLENHCLSPKGKDCETEPDGSPSPETPNVIQNQRRDWNDTFGIRVGGSYWTSDEVELFAGLGFSSNAVPNETLEPALADFHSVSFSLGGRFELSEDFLYLAASYTQILYVPREVKKSEHSALRQPSRSPSANGEYNQMVGVVNANLEFVF
jgi:long-chain fatty acid transport protein